MEFISCTSHEMNDASNDSRIVFLIFVFLLFRCVCFFLVLERGVLINRLSVFLEERRIRIIGDSMCSIVKEWNNN